jgi:small subunit ribosomal protein S6
MRRYELMLVLRPDAPDERAQAVLERTTRTILADGGQVVKAQPWGRRRLAYAIDRYREGQYHILVFEDPPTTVAELERGLLITEEVLRHLVIRIERPLRASKKGDVVDGADIETIVPPSEDDEPEIDGEMIDESESEAAPAAVD